MYRLWLMVICGLASLGIVAFPIGGIAQDVAAISGTVADAGTALPVSGALVTLFRGDVAEGTSTTDENGSFRFGGRSPGIYTFTIVAQGFMSSRSDDVVVAVGSSRAQFNIALQRASSSSSTLHEIGRAVSSGRGAPALNTSSVITQSISPERLQRENYVRVAEALNALPGVNLRGQDSAIGDDVFVDIRGEKASNAQVLLDGHPVGPEGVFGIVGGSQYGFNAYNFQLSPFFALRDILVSYGSGGQSLYGTSTIGGSIDFQTVDPTAKPQFIFQQGLGTQGKSLTALQLTGTRDKLGYAIVQGIQGTQGSFAPQVNTQSAFLGQDQTSNTIASVTHAVASNYELRQTLLKGSYAFSPATNVTLATYLASSWDDKTGNGDNDFLPFATQLYNVQAQLAAGNGSIPFTDANGVTHSCFSGVSVQTDAGFRCYSAQQYAAATSGPAGSPLGLRFQGLNNWDYHARLRTRLGAQNFAIDSYVDRISQNTQRTRQILSRWVQSYGLQLADDIVSEKNAFGFGFFHEQQRLYGFDAASGGPLTPRADLGQGNSNVFLRDAYTPAGKVSAFGNVWFKHSTVATGTQLSPRLSLVYHATPSDIVRFSAAEALGFPSVTLLSSPTTFTDPNGGTFPNFASNCGGFTTVGDASSRALSAERSKELELTYGHRFKGDSLFQVALYNSNVREQILSGRVPITSVPGASSDPAFLAFLPQYLATINTKFGCTPTISNLVVNSAINADSAKYQGIELAGRYRVGRNLFVDYAYNVQSAVQSGIPLVQQKDDPTLIPGSQIYGTPLHKASLGIDFNDLRGLEVRIDGFYIGAPNALNRAAYGYVNGAITKQIGGLTLNLGVNNAFNQYSSQYGNFGLQKFVPENQYGSDKNSFDQYFNGVGPGEQFSIAPQTFFITLSARLAGR